MNIGKNLILSIKYSKLIVELTIFIIISNSSENNQTFSLPLSKLRHIVEMQKEWSEERNLYCLLIFCPLSSTLLTLALILRS
jgi:hypothetical protein